VRSRLLALASLCSLAAYKGGDATPRADNEAAEPVAAAAVAPLGGISGMARGGVVYLPVDLTPSEYGFLGFLPDANDGKPHIAHGMLKQITVK